jgi:hypothetical protein
VFTPSTFEGKSDGKPKYGFTAIWTPNKFSESDKKRWKAMRALLNEASMDKFKKAWKDLPANFKRGLRDGVEKADLEGFGPGTFFANITSQMRPGVIDAGRSPIGPDHGNTDDLYPGCYCRATVTAYAYDNKGKGVALGLQNLQKVADGDRLDARTNAEDDFEDDIDSEWLDDDDIESTGEDDDPLG